MEQDPTVSTGGLLQFHSVGKINSKKRTIRCIEIRFEVICNSDSDS